MSLFIRMAQTRAGAERLLEAQLLPILSQCDYLDARPEADQSFMGEFLFDIMKKTNRSQLSRP
jgi:nuclear pore complex protein Nup205